MRKYYCNGKKGFCDRYNGETEPSCIACIHGDGTGGEVIENITNYDRIRNMSVEEMASFFEKIQADVQFDNKSKYAFEWKRWLESEVDTE